MHKTDHAGQLAALGENQAADGNHRNACRDGATGAVAVQQHAGEGP
ncbi:MAG: hypothetical protein M3Y93_11765 [Pseudomonadota bacterium]|nr:hypothetical protein [Pseudomonadota bacterium]